MTDKRLQVTPPEMIQKAKARIPLKEFPGKNTQSRDKINRQSGRQTDRHADRLTGRQTDRQRKRHIADSLKRIFIYNCESNLA